MANRGGKDQSRAGSPCSRIFVRGRHGTAGPLRYCGLAGIDSANSRSPTFLEVLEEARRVMLPVYAEVDDATNAISDRARPVDYSRTFWGRKGRATDFPLGTSTDAEP